MTLSADEALITRLLDVISGDAPMADTAHLLAPGLISHMDRFTVHGTEVWFDWLEFLQSRAGGELRVDVDRFVAHPDGTITAFGWLRTARSDNRTPQPNQATYRIADGRVAEIWTSRANYEMIFGAKVRHPMHWLLVLVEMAVWRRLPWSRRVRSSLNVEELGDGGRNQSRGGLEAHDYPERGRSHRDRDRGHGA